ncbi:hypothetical protein E4U46_002076 [Claviceps purpurea]|nr:hypothetical protein E4U46_002076 [Claviceps purpurea]
MTTTSPTSQVPTLVALASEEAEEVDEPPESKHKFERTVIRRRQDQPSMLTKAIMGELEEHHSRHPKSILVNSQRRRSITSNVSIASTADLTSDTGMTSPCRTNTPSPPIPEMAGLRLHAEIAERMQTSAGMDNSAQLPKKRCIQFVCAAKPPPPPQPIVRAPSADHVPKRPSIKFACAAPRPHSTQSILPRRVAESNVPPRLPTNSASPSTPKKASALSAALDASTRLSSARRSPVKVTSCRPKFLRATSKDLVKDGSQFHEFAPGTTREEDWIRQSPSVVSTKITINDTLSKENHFRRLAAEAEAEAEMEDTEETADADDDIEDEDEEDDDDDDEAAEEEEEEEDDDDFDDDSDGYHTDSETGFAESDDDEDDDENMILWTPGHTTARQTIVTANPIRRTSLHEPQSDSSTASRASRSSTRRVRTRRIKIDSVASDLPDSTDFVCGTLDEDRPLEEAYLSCRAARRNEKLRIIPQDIDPSFPASDPDDDDEEEIFNPVHHNSDDAFWVQGNMDDLHHGQQDRCRRRKRGEQVSPRKLRSPPPMARRHFSPPPKPRGHSPKPLFGRPSPKRMRSPAPKALTTPSQTPRQGPHVQFQLAGRPNTTLTKSLPRHPALFTAMKSSKSTKQQTQSDGHLRGAIDIVKGLERKRERRKEKFFQKYCNRARRGQIPERKHQPGLGAERMKELGLLMAGKKDPGNYVLSV